MTAYVPGQFNGNTCLINYMMLKITRQFLSWAKMWSMAISMKGRDIIVFCRIFQNDVSLIKLNIWIRNSGYISHFVFFMSNNKW
jgi:hypothetical protein